MLNYLINSYIAKLTEEKEHLESQLSEYPDIHFYITHQGKYSKWYEAAENNTASYIPKKNRERASLLATSKYLRAHLDDLVHELSLLTRLQKRLENPSVHNYLADPAYYELIEDTYKNRGLPQYALDWMNSNYTHNPYYTENLSHHSKSGNILRSKSELLIDMMLYDNNIPYRYECELVLNGVPKYPDFTILSISSGQEIYWEHFGMMNNAKYARDSSSKILDYIENGIIPGINLICTYETSDYPLSPITIQRCIDLYLK